MADGRSFLDNETYTLMVIFMRTLIVLIKGILKRSAKEYAETNKHTY